MAGRKGLSTIIATMLNLHGTFDFRTEAYPPPRPYLPSRRACVGHTHPDLVSGLKKRKNHHCMRRKNHRVSNIFSSVKKIGHSGKLIFPECRTRGRESFSSTTDTRGRETLREVVSTQDPVGYCCADIC
jgi:hypothetical protein